MEEQLIEILTRLVDLKDYKDKYGKDEHYLREQPVLWEKARTLLKACEGKSDQTSEKDLRVCDVNARFYDSDEEDEDFEEEEPDYKECMCCGNVQQYGMSCDKCAGPTKDGFL